MDDRLFTNKDLRAMIIPLFVEQFLLLLVGIADTFVVSFVGDSAVSGVSLVNSFNTVIIFLFSALASGGAQNGAADLVDFRPAPRGDVLEH